MSMMGSGIYSQEAEIEIVCKERCYDCKSDCDAVFTISIMRDDWGNIDEDVKCEKCNHSYRYREDKY